ncbi:hypothetical protein AB0G06_43590 [Nonomuraea dietziae]|uniref:hypothetical protein n=1 Tax=Nonomuraea dietziae TaxID=65515 RepID=UPI0033F247CD
MSGCGTNLDGRAIVEVYENGLAVQDYDHWVKNYIAVQQRVAEGLFEPDAADLSGTCFYMKEAGDQILRLVAIECDEQKDGTVRVRWYDYDEDGLEFPYRDENRKVLEFSFDPYEGLTRYTFTIVRREFGDPVPDSWNGTMLYGTKCPLKVTQLHRGLWAWIDSYTIDVGVSGDVVVTPYGEDPCVSNPLATRHIAVRTGA